MSARRKRFICSCDWPRNVYSIYIKACRDGWYRRRDSGQWLLVYLETAHRDHHPMPAYHLILNTLATLMCSAHDDKCFIESYIRPTIKSVTYYISYNHVLSSTDIVSSKEIKHQCKSYLWFSASFLSRVSLVLSIVERPLKQSVTIG